MLMPMFSIKGSSFPTKSIDYEASSSQYLSISDANFGSYTSTKFSFFTWFKLETTGANNGVYAHNGAAGNRAFSIILTSANKINIRTYNDGTNINGQLVTTPTYGDTNWHSLLFHFDSANGTAGNRMRLWVDNAEVTTFDTDTNPSGGVFNSSADIVAGASDYVGALPFDGLLYQTSFFDNVLVSTSDVMTAGAKKEFIGVSGLKSYLNCGGGSVVADGILAADWTNNNTAVTSSTIPT